MFRLINTRTLPVAIAVLVMACVPAVSGFTTPASTKSFHGTLLHTSESSQRLYATKSSEQRQPWDVLRFVKQSSKFVNMPFPAPRSSKVVVGPGEALWQPSSISANSNKKLGFQFSPLDDVVMGGASSSTFDNASGLWKGVVTDANNGGFSGIRTTANSPVFDLSSCRGLQFTMQTTDKMPQRLKLVVRDSPEFNGIAWTASVNLLKPSSLPMINNNKQKQITVRVPLDSRTFVPTIFANIIEEKKDTPVDKSQLSAIQLVYSKFEFEGKLNPKFQVGDFDLQLLEVRTY